MNKGRTHILLPNKGRDEFDIRSLFNKHYKELCTFALKFVVSCEVAEDIVQEVFINLWEKNRLDTIKSSPRSYLYAAVRNNSLNYLRKNGRFLSESLEVLMDELIEENIDIEELEEKKEKLYRELDKLSPKSRKVFNAVVFQNMKYKEAAEAMDISVNTIKTHLARAMKQLRKAMVNIFCF